MVERIGELLSPVIVELFVAGVVSCSVAGLARFTPLQRNTGPDYSRANGETTH